ncbi:hypothetical protein Q4575_01960 [Psychrosphaera sp. 1_MG-2023]|uniref:hypothetical protein n=1 Tax=Psychrosphaera sp. 1_MG-2023 TaxID=3062643 RepID=UPI0026E2827D|nr:hypothetical protein [Psychrosphaera sp. 1_MG-2023]MDO6718144.1 hypothetical protein [Psychrosphaera sp. 1_MG-2023]
MMTSKDKQFDDLISDLEPELAPKRDLWAGIEQAITNVPQQTTSELSSSTIKSTPWLKVAAMFAPVALVTGLWLGLPKGIDQQIEEPSWLTPVSASFELQKQQLLQRVSNTNVVSPNWRSSLTELELAEKALKKALIHQPEDAVLMKMLTQIHQQQLALISKSHQSKFTQI